MLSHLELFEVGPAPQMRVDFAPRLNLLTGDNGLGKTFILDVAWWAVSRSWAGAPALPDLEQARKPAIKFNYSETPDNAPLVGEYNFSNQRWSLPDKRQTRPMMAVYVRADGGISVLDPVKDAKALIFQHEQIWEGLRLGQHQACNGLLADWVAWQTRQDDGRALFETFSEVLRELSASEAEGLLPGKPRRISLKDAREIPTLELPYGTTPVTLASAGMRRVLALAYILVWMWAENRNAAAITRKQPARQMIVLLDEVESHLHPQWQRRLLPALLRVLSKLHPEMDVQLVASTHSPLVLASLEPLFDEERDALTVFDLVDGKVEVRRADWRLRGDASAWLTSDVFGLGEARSVEAEAAIQAAMDAIDRADMDVKELGAIHEKLKTVLKDTDPFWPRWQFYAERKGVAA